MLVSGWINPFLANVRKHQSDRVRGELTLRELRQAKEQIIKTTQQKCFPDKNTGTKRKEASSQQQYITKDYAEALRRTP